MILIPEFRGRRLQFADHRSEVARAASRDRDLDVEGDMLPCSRIDLDVDPRGATVPASSFGVLTAGRINFIDGGFMVLLSLWLSWVYGSGHRGALVLGTLVV